MYTMTPPLSGLLGVHEPENGHGPDEGEAHSAQHSRHDVQLGLGLVI